MRETAMKIVMLLILVLAGGCASKPEQPVVPDTGRGQMLYERACAACHTEQAHWREKRLVRDWHGLLHQVTRWNDFTKQQWRPDEIQAVADYLNQKYYHLP